MNKTYEYFNTAEHIEEAYLPYDPLNPYCFLTDEAKAAVSRESKETGVDEKELKDWLDNKFAAVL